MNPEANPASSAEADAFADEPDDVEGHRMLSPEQAQERAESARSERERGQ